jgi:hypothetical protein
MREQNDATSRLRNCEIGLQDPPAHRDLHGFFMVRILFFNLIHAVFSLQKLSKGTLGLDAA